LLLLLLLRLGVLSLLALLVLLLLLLLLDPLPLLALLVLFLLSLELLAPLVLLRLRLGVLSLLFLLLLLLLLLGVLSPLVLLPLLAGRSLLAFRPVLLFALVVFFALIVVLCVGRSNGSAEQQHWYYADKKEFHGVPAFISPVTQARGPPNRTNRLPRFDLDKTVAGQEIPSRGCRAASVALSDPRLSTAPAPPQPAPSFPVFWYRLVLPRFS
jgi:hypothetical protein